ncbi:MAG: hypothetical protein ACFNL3_09395, partial [Rothia aeria]
YIKTSTIHGTPFDICLVALSRLAQDKNPAARELMDEIQGQWYELIRAEIGDDKMARTVLLLGGRHVLQCGICGRHGEPGGAQTHQGRSGYSAGCARHSQARGAVVFVSA